MSVRSVTVLASSADEPITAPPVATYSHCGTLNDFYDAFDNPLAALLSKAI